jgi:Na+/H+-dicarboxylate symporter
VSLTSRVLAGLVAGFALGLVLAATGSQVSGPVLAVASPIGTIFINLIRMTVMPLVVSMLIASVGSLGATEALRGALGRAAVIAVALLTIAAVVSVAVAAPVFARVQIDRTAAAAIGAAAGQAAPHDAGALSLGQWFIDLIPQNVFKSAADGQMLPVIVFAVLFGIALSRAPEAPRGAVLRVADGVAAAMHRLVASVLELAPFGIFALAVPLAARLGLAAAGAVIEYIVVVVALTVAVGALLLYPVGIVWGGMSPPAFVRFCAPAQAVAFASRSSLAALPAMVESADRAALPPVISGFLLPLAASVFRLGAAVAQTVGVLFLAQLYGVALSPAQLASIVFTVVLTTFAVPGIPGGSIIAMVPVLATAGIPIDGIGILMAVDTVPDMFRTTENVTGSLALAAVLRKNPRNLPAAVSE